MDKISKHDQIPINFSFCNKKALENYISGGNEHLIDALKAFARDNLGQLIYLCGKKSTGKSHLCRATFDIINDTKIYVDQSSYDMLSDIDISDINYLILDDFEVLLEKDNSEDLLFYYINEFILANKSVLISTIKPIEDINFTKNDLKSRLKSNLIFNIKEISDEEKIRVVKKITEDIGWTIEENVCQYIMNHYQRDLFFLCNVLKSLDKNSLVLKRRVTIPFVKNIIQRSDIR
tara:strand:+ start:4246 stop:4947 length:702 start_codon:yes stop_codon:yes gene_type:complete